MNKNVIILICTVLFIVGCTPSSRKENANLYKKGEYGYDLEFLKKHIEQAELKNGASRLIVAPQYQGRVMTCSSSGMKGFSHGWINYDLISSGKIDEYGNSYGGEERIWLGPEGGQFSVFFTEKNPGKWIVPASLDREAFNVVFQDSQQITLEKDIELVNRSDTKFDAKITRKIKILNSFEIEALLKTGFGKSVRVIAYKSVTHLQNTGDINWDKRNGALSIWMLSMLKASPNAVAIIPLNQKGDGNLVNDYFGGISESRLKVIDKTVFFKVDGKFRSKIGIPPFYALPYIGSYDTKNQILSIIEYSLPEGNNEYVNSLLTDFQNNPFAGDVLNVYNDGPSGDGSRIGKVYELETSSPAAFLKPGEEIEFIQYMYHFEGDEDELDFLSKHLLMTSLSNIKNSFYSN